MSEDVPSVGEQVAQLQGLLDLATAETMKAVQGGGTDLVFDAGMQMGVLVGIGLATAHRIREGMSRDKYRASGQGEFYKRHAARAEAFGELANALKQWNHRHRVGESQG